jgi:acyl-coenzyme A synthetase/AMP-(fatty) acid ligase
VDFVTHLLALTALGAQPFCVDHRLPEQVALKAADAAGATHRLDNAEPMPTTAGYSESPAVMSTLPGDGRRSEHLYLQLSSGTTDDPKLIGHSAADVVDELTRYRELGGIAPRGGSVLAACALASAWGVCGSLIGTLGDGFELVLAASPTPRGLYAALAESDRPTVIQGVPIHVAMLAASGPAPRGLAGVLVSGGTVAEAEARAAADALGAWIGQVYGSTETGLIAADLRGRRPGTAGVFPPSVRTRLRTDGELEVGLDTSPYVHSSLANGRWRDSWFRTHDAVEIDADGTVRVLGRLDGLVSLGGKKFHVAEVEYHLRGDSAIEDAVAFVDGGRIEAFVTLVAGADLDARRVRGAVPEHMRPHTMTLLARMPRTPSGKISRRRELFAAAAESERTVR